MRRQEVTPHEQVKGGPLDLVNGVCCHVGGKNPTTKSLDF